MSLSSYSIQNTHATSEMSIKFNSVISCQHKLHIFHDLNKSFLSKIFEICVADFAAHTHYPRKTGASKSHRRWRLIIPSIWWTFNSFIFLYKSRSHLRTFKLITYWNMCIKGRFYEGFCFLIFYLFSLFCEDMDWTLTNKMV